LEGLLRLNGLATEFILSLALRSGSSGCRALLLCLRITSALGVFFAPALSFRASILSKWVQWFSTTSSTTTTLHDASSVGAPDHGVKRIGRDNHQAMGVASVRSPGLTADSASEVVRPADHSNHPSWAIIVPLSMQYMRGGAWLSPSRS
jgi:hypothetical protein